MKGLKASSLNPSTVSIIIPCFNEENFIIPCVESCLNQSFNGSLEIIVVDGNSTDQSLVHIQRLIDEHPKQVRVIHNPQRITPVSLNLGLQNSHADFKMILGAHSTLPRQFILSCLHCFQDEPDAACVGGIILNQYANTTAENIGLAMSSPFGVGNATFRIGGEKKWVDTVAFGMYKKEVFEKIGWFNEDLIRNQDDEFNFRLTQAGLKILFDPSIQSHYFVRASYKKLWKQYFQYGFWKVYVNILHHHVTSIRQLFPAAFFAYLLTLFGMSLWTTRYFLIGSIPFGLYLLLSFFFAFKKKPSQFLSIALVFPILHLSYRLGNWKGIIQLGIFKIKPKVHHAKHNR